MNAEIQFNFVWSWAHPERQTLDANIGASIIRIGFWGPLCHNYNCFYRPPNTVLVIDSAPIVNHPTLDAESQVLVARAIGFIGSPWRLLIRRKLKANHSNERAKSRRSNGEAAV